MTEHFNRHMLGEKKGITDCHSKIKLSHRKTWGMIHRSSDFKVEKFDAMSESVRAGSTIGHGSARFPIVADGMFAAH